MAADMTRHRVTATMVVVRVPGAAGGETYLRRDALLPESVTAEEVTRLTMLGLIAPANAVKASVGGEAVVSLPVGEPTEEWNLRQLDKYAADNSIDLGSAKTKPDKVAKIIEATTSV